MKIKYVGKKPLPLKLNTPIPFLAKSDGDGGELVFTPECDVPNDDWAEFLLTQCGEAFVLAEVAVDPASPEAKEKTRLHEAIQKALGRRFKGKAGKWQAKAYIKKHGLQAHVGLKKFHIGEKVLGWDLVAITDEQAEGCLDEAIPAEAEGQLEEEVTDEREVTV